MLSNVVRIIQQIASKTTLCLCLGTLKLWFNFSTSTQCSPLLRTKNICFIIKKAFVKYLSYATLGANIACFGNEVFMFLWRVIFGRFLAEDEQKPKLVSARPQISLWCEKCVTIRNSTNSKIFLHYVIVIFQTVSPTRRQTYNCYSSL